MSLSGRVGTLTNLFMDKVLLALKDIFETARREKNSPLLDVKRIYIGDPINIQENVLPALIVHPERTTYIKRGTRYDEKIHSISIKLVYNSKDYYGEESSGQTNSIIGAEIKGGSILFETDLPHNCSVGDGVYITGADPEEYNSTFEITRIFPKKLTTLKVSTILKNLGAYIGSGVLHKGKTNTLFGVMDAVDKTERTNENNETVQNTICGILEKNARLNYNGKNFADNSTMEEVSYLFNKERPFPSFEVIVPLNVQVIANR